MLCDNCKRREATVHITQIINGAKEEQNLCMHCAREKAAAVSGGRSASHEEKIWQLLRNIGIVGVVVAPTMTQHTLHDQDVDLEGLGLHLPGSDEAACASESVLSLKAELESAVNNENFERAAELRDKIYRLENPIQKGQA